MTDTWQTRAACRGLNPGPWYSESETVKAQAKDVCAGCPVRTACLEAAVAVREQHGIWGGLDVRERRNLIRRRQRAQAAAAA